MSSSPSLFNSENDNYGPISSTQKDSETPKTKSQFTTTLEPIFDISPIQNISWSPLKSPTSRQKLYNLVPIPKESKSHLARNLFSANKEDTAIPEATPLNEVSNNHLTIKSRYQILKENAIKSALPPCNLSLYEGTTLTFSIEEDISYLKLLEKYKSQKSDKNSPLRNGTALSKLQKTLKSELLFLRRERQLKMENNIKILEEENYRLDKDDQLDEIEEYSEESNTSLLNKAVRENNFETENELDINRNENDEKIDENEDSENVLNSHNNEVYNIRISKNNTTQKNTSDNEENDSESYVEPIIFKKKVSKRSNLAFIDDEAEVSGSNDEENEDEDEDEDEDEENEYEDEENVDEDEENEDEDEENEDAENEDEENDETQDGNTKDNNYKENDYKEYDLVQSFDENTNETYDNSNENRKTGKRKVNHNIKVLKDEVFDKPIDVKDFFENEAELSGSEVSSDEEEEGLDEIDEMQLDNSDLPSNSKLRKEIGKIYQKQLLDEDKRLLLEYQERYLEDGDLHSCNKREKKFRWKDANSVWLDNARDSDDSEESEYDEDQEVSFKLNKNITLSDYKIPVASSATSSVVSKTFGPSDLITSYVVRDEKLKNLLSTKRANPFDKRHSKRCKNDEPRKKSLFEILSRY